MIICVDIVKYLDGALVQKISKRHFFEDIENSFHEVTHIGLKPHQFFFLFKISQQIWMLEAVKVLAEIGIIWLAD